MNNKFDLLNLIKCFIDRIKYDEIYFYNETSLQFELTFFLRNKLKDKYNVFIEYNINKFDLSNLRKRDMDIVIFTSNKKEYKSCIELKYPTKGQYPEQMFKACVDIKFLEELIESGFNTSYFIMFANYNDNLFWEGKKYNGIYNFFRKGKNPIRNKVKKPTGDKDEELNFNREYMINWFEINRKYKYFIIEVKND